jgi:hypothetical protein
MPRKHVSPHIVSPRAQRGLFEPNALLGYTRVSTSNQDAQLQLDALLAVGVQKRDVFADVISGSKTAMERSGMKKLLDYAEGRDTVVVWRVDRLGRSLIDVHNTVTGGDVPIDKSLSKDTPRLSGYVRKNEVFPSE